MAHKLDVLETCCDALVAGCRKAEEVDRYIAVVTAAALHRIEDRLYLAVNDLRSVLGSGIEEEVTGIVLIIGAVDITVMNRHLEIGRHLAVPLLLLCCLLCGFDRLLDLSEGRLVLLRDQAGDGILLLTAVDALRFPDIRKRDAARNDDLGCGCCVIGCHRFTS